jgi:endonuclease YncB( thermonuclease family)
MDLLAEKYGASRLMLVILSTIAALVAGCGRPRQPPVSTLRSPTKPRPPASLPMPSVSLRPIASVQDGDTLRAIGEAWVEQRIRLHGIDAPELGQPFGNVTRERLAAVEASARGRASRDVA